MHSAIARSRRRATAPGLARPHLVAVGLLGARAIDAAAGSFADAAALDGLVLALAGSAEREPLSPQHEAGKVSTTTTTTDTLDPPDDTIRCTPCRGARGHPCGSADCRARTNDSYVCKNGPGNYDCICSADSLKDMHGWPQEWAPGTTRCVRIGCKPRESGGKMVKSPACGGKCCRAPEKCGIFNDRRCCARPDHPPRQQWENGTCCAFGQGILCNSSQHVTGGCCFNANAATKLHDPHDECQPVGSNCRFYEPCPSETIPGCDCTAFRSGDTACQASCCTKDSPTPHDACQKSADQCKLFDPCPGKSVEIAGGVFCERWCLAPWVSSFGSPSEPCTETLMPNWLFYTLAPLGGGATVVGLLAGAVRAARCCSRRARRRERREVVDQVSEAVTSGVVDQVGEVVSRLPAPELMLEDGRTCKITEFKDPPLRVVLLIGCNDFKQFKQLTNPVADVEALAKLYAAMGYIVFTELNPTKKAMCQVMKQVRRRIAELGGASMAGILLTIHYAGHGEVLNGDLHLAGVDSKPSTASTQFSLFRLTKELFNAHLKDGTSKLVKLNVVCFLDCCMEQPAEAKLARDSLTAVRLGRHLRHEEVPDTMRRDWERATFRFLFATQLNRTVSDEAAPGAQHSAVAEALLVELRKHQSLNDLFHGVSQYVLKRTGRQRQEPCFTQEIGVSECAISLFPRAAFALLATPPDAQGEASDGTSTAVPSPNASFHSRDRGLPACPEPAGAHR